MMDLGIYLDAWVKAEGILATFMKKFTISGRRMMNPEIIASVIKKGRKL